MISDQSEDMIYMFKGKKEAKGVGGGSKFYCTKCLARAASSENENQALENCSLRPGTVTW